MKYITSLLAFEIIDIDNYNNIKERTIFSNKVNSKTVLMFLSILSKLYYDKNNRGERN